MVPHDRRGPHPRRDGRRKLEGDPDIKGYYDVCVSASQGQPETGLYFDQDWASLPPSCRWLRRIHAGQMHQLLHTWARTW